MFAWLRSQWLTMTTYINGDTTPNQVLSQDQIFAEINSAVSELEPLLPITPEQRQLLLLKFNWDIESLRNSFQEYADLNRFLVKNGISSENIVHVVDNAECDICCATGRLLGLECRHMACENCWNTHIRTKIENGQCLLGCMDFGCDMLISNEMLGRFLHSSELQVAHTSLIKDSYISRDSSLAWCNKKCGMAVRRSNNNTVTCSCGSTFCFVCRLDAHYPATCRQVRDWEKHHSNFMWISLHSKECPKCFVPIEKNGGCNHMTCYRCRYQYCWICSRKWATQPYRCEPSDITVAQSRSNFSGKHLSRFEHQRKRLERDQRILSATSSKSTIKFQKTLNECRRTLMYSYIFGYFLKDEVHTRLLEEHQQKLQMAVICLDVNRTRPEAKDCLTHRKALLAHCAKVAEIENLEGRQPVERFTIDTYDYVDSDEFSDATVIAVSFGISFIIAVLYESMRK